MDNENQTVPAMFLNRSDFVLSALYSWIVENDGKPLVAVNTMIEGVTVTSDREVDDKGMITYNLSPQAVRNLIIQDGFVSFDASMSGVKRNISFPCVAVAVIFDQNSGYAEEVTNLGVQQWIMNQQRAAENKTKEAPKPAEKKAPFLTVIK
jgi:stringent starvation protein B